MAAASAAHDAAGDSDVTGLCAAQMCQPIPIAVDSSAAEAGLDTDSPCWVGIEPANSPELLGNRLPVVLLDAALAQWDGLSGVSYL